MQRALILSAAFGAGHFQAAQAIAQAWQAACPGAQATALNLQSPVLDMVVSSYLKLLTYAPGAYRRLYRAPVNAGMRKMIHTALAPRVRFELQTRQPDVVIATHPFPGAVAAYQRHRGRLSTPVAMVVTDFIPHGLWVCEGVDYYFVPSETGAETLVRLGVAPHKIRVVGIPIRPEFQSLPQRVTTDQVRHLLVMGGGLGLGPIIEAVRSIAQSTQEHLRVKVVCGANEALRAELQQRFGHDSRLTMIGYTNEVHRLMAEADLLVSKPGGVTCSEALACGLPILLLRPLPGQEEENAEHLTHSGAARVVSEDAVGGVVTELLFNHPGQLALMQQAALHTGRPQSAHHIVEQLLTHAAFMPEVQQQVANS